MISSIAVVSLLGIGSGLYFYRQYASHKQTVQNSENTPVPETQDLIAKVQKLILLPDEEPQIMTVTNADDLKKTQLFFQDAHDDDTVLIFKNAKKAYIYRQSENIIINMAPIKNLDQKTDVPILPQGDTLPEKTGNTNP